MLFISFKKKSPTSNLDATPLEISHTLIDMGQESASNPQYSELPLDCHVMVRYILLALGGSFFKYSSDMGNI